ncbi:STAS domain-containing protein [Pseudenhygromyxa sp. WMMC2535]|uniref:STAS domain-containing protein n=1 Tax=Pseudenhygromyxa sp. WMMC2535 TaxID=2712867 RepID=UPI0015580D46|nr:STAS domain-containing protein [Pseudenhygromyxa sp. WMMC2535]NVB38854.1 STAS domain-containing protein [Pseudenhygromyxa sp. WMMC2535]
MDNFVTCIPLWDCLLVPLHGDVSDDQADVLVTDVLERIKRDECFGVLVDLSGVWTLDSHLCAVLARLAMAARLMGAKTVLSGMRPEIAMTLEAMGIELRGIETVATLEDALGTMGITRVRQPRELEDDMLMQSLLDDSRESEPRGRGKP